MTGKSLRRSVSPVEAGGVDWVDCFIESESGEYSFLGALAVGDFTPATYDVSVAAPGLDEPVTETAELTVEPAG